MQLMSWISQCRKESNRKSQADPSPWCMLWLMQTGALSSLIATYPGILLANRLRPQNGSPGWDCEWLNVAGQSSKRLLDGKLLPGIKLLLYWWLFENSSKETLGHSYLKHLSGLSMDLYLKAVLGTDALNKAWANEISVESIMNAAGARLCCW